MLEADLLAILDAGPVTVDDLACLTQQQQRRALASIDSLIAVLDLLDGDADLEPETDLEDGADAEPSLGSPEAGFGLDVALGRVAVCGTLDQRRWAAGLNKPGTDECEPVSEDEGACIQSQPHDEEPDGEPSLGALDRRWDQTHWLGMPNEQGFGSSDGGQDGWRRPRRERIRYTESPARAANRAVDRLRAIRGLPPRGDTLKRRC